MFIILFYLLFVNKSRHSVLNHLLKIMNNAFSYADQWSPSSSSYKVNSCVSYLKRWSLMRGKRLPHHFLPVCPSLQHNPPQPSDWYFLPSVTLPSLYLFEGSGICRQKCDNKSVGIKMRQCYLLPVFKLPPALSPSLHIHPLVMLLAGMVV